MTDADVDGAPVAALLLTFFFIVCCRMITHGRNLFLATPPLYKKQCPKRAEALFDDAALTRYRAEHKGKLYLQRYKVFRRDGCATVMEQR